MRRSCLLVAAVLATACSDPAANSGSGATQGIEVPDDGSIVPLSQPYEVTPEGLSFMTASGASSGSSGGYLAMSCSLTSTGRRCQLLWVGASATSLIALATCMTSVISPSCAGAIVATGYAWDQWRNEPDCMTCNSPFSMENSGQWARTDKWPYFYPPDKEDAGSY